MKRLAALIVPITALVSALAPAQENLEMGKMWTFENPPLTYLQEEYSFAPDQNWLDSLRLASLRYGNGCSASFISPKGLIMTNHHCARSHIASVSPADQDWGKTGFYAKALTDEVKVPGLTCQQLIAMKDVTSAMNKGILDDDPKAAEKRKANERKVLAQARQDHPGLQPEIVKLHQGAVFQLYTYKIWNDIRLVCAPHLQTAHFGGDPDNFTYPRYGIDFTFVRAYDNGKPADTSRHYFRWKNGGAKEGDLVFVTGNPGSTGRLLTKAQMEYLRDAQYPMVRDIIDTRLAGLRAQARANPAAEKALRTQMFSLENAQKAYKGYHTGLLDENLMAQKAQAEAAFKAKIAADPRLNQAYGQVWDKLEKVAKELTDLEPKKRLYSTMGSQQLARAVAIIQRVAGGEGPDPLNVPLKLPGGAKGAQRKSFYLQIERAKKWLAPDDALLTAILGDRTPEATADLLEKSRVKSEKFVQRLLSKELSVEKTKDPAIAMARTLIALRSEVAARLSELQATQSELGIQIGKALFAAYGNKVSPDATFTLRFSDGVVAGFPFNGTIAPYKTSFYGLYGRNIEFENAYPFNLPQIWLDRKDQVDMTKAVDFVSTNDIIGGNSGSPVVSKELEVVGLIFDGNIEMLSNRFVYTDAVPRSVSVHVDAIMEALTKIYDADRVVEELVGQPAAPIKEAGLRRDSGKQKARSGR